MIHTSSPSVQTMQAHAAVFRTGAVLKEGCDKMDAVYQTLDDVKTFDRGTAPNCVSLGGFFVFAVLCSRQLATQQSPSSKLEFQLQSVAPHQKDMVEWNKLCIESASHKA